MNMITIDIAKLANVKKKEDGRIIARCPACAQKGQDGTGDHLVVFKDGKYACVCYPGKSDEAKDHRKQIAQLVGKAVNEQDRIIDITIKVKKFTCPPIEIKSIKSELKEELSGDNIIPAITSRDKIKSVVASNSDAPNTRSDKNIKLILDKILQSRNREMRSRKDNDVTTTYN